MDDRAANAKRHQEVGSSWYESDDELAPPPSSFQTRFADVVRDATGTDEHRSAITHTLDMMDVHHEAMTSTAKMAEAMTTIESARAAFGIEQAKTLQAIKKIMQLIQARRIEWQAQNPGSDVEWILDNRFMSMFQEGVAGGGPGPAGAASGESGATRALGRGAAAVRAASGAPRAVVESSPPELIALGATSSTGSTAEAGPAAMGAQDPEGKSNIDARSMMSYMCDRDGVPRVTADRNDLQKRIEQMQHMLRMLSRARLDDFVGGTALRFDPGEVRGLLRRYRSDLDLTTAIKNCPCLITVPVRRKMKKVEEPLNWRTE